MAVLLVAAGVSGAWSFRSFLEGEWTLERTRGRAITRAYYSLNSTTDGSLAGRYYEENSDGEPSNRMNVLVQFEDKEGRVGKFQLAKLKSWEDTEEDPTPVPEEQLSPQTVFHFEFTPQLEERFWLSESSWLGSSGGKVQLLAADDSFVISRVSLLPAKAAGDAPSVLLSTWTAVRTGAPRPSRASDAPVAKRSMLQRWGPYLGTTLVFLTYKVVKHGGKK
mmetsp:Transcript_250/g.372  ORF Transcript_250/g.372 Transcript_250/m.372 type:complete len:221 (-) Transcript_250:92-754(-)